MCVGNTMTFHRQSCHTMWSSTRLHSGSHTLFYIRATVKLWLTLILHLTTVMQRTCNYIYPSDQKDNIAILHFCLEPITNRMSLNSLQLNPDIIKVLLSGPHSSSQVSPCPTCNKNKPSVKNLWIILIKTFTSIISHHVHTNLPSLTLQQITY